MASSETKYWWLTEEVDVEGYRRHRQCDEDEASKAFVDYESTVIKDVIKDQKHFAKGGFALVYKAKLGGNNVAIKVPQDKNMEDERLAFHKEVEILRRIRHPYIVVLHGACVQECALVYEFLPEGTLEARLSEERRNYFSWEERIHVAANISTALVYLHDSLPDPITHSDLKPLNILFDAENLCKLADFGISRFLGNNTTGGTRCHVTEESKGTGSYKDPCFDKSNRLTSQADVFAFGIILLQLVTGEGALSLRDIVSEQMKKLNGRVKLLRTLRLIDATWDSNDKSRKIALQMLELGLQCSEPERKERPNFKQEVWTKISSIAYEEVPAFLAQQQAWWGRFSPNIQSGTDPVTATPAISAITEQADRAEEVQEEVAEIAGSGMEYVA